jgi:hypothetical protein
MPHTEHRAELSRNEAQSLQKEAQCQAEQLEDQSEGNNRPEGTQVVYRCERTNLGE